MTGATTGVTTGVMTGVMTGGMSGFRLRPADGETLAARAAMTGVMTSGRFVLIGKEVRPPSKMVMSPAVPTAVTTAVTTAATTAATAAVTTSGVVNRALTCVITGAAATIARRVPPWGSGMGWWDRVATTAVISGRPATNGCRDSPADGRIPARRGGTTDGPCLAKAAVTSGATTEQRPVWTAVLIGRLAMIGRHSSSGELSRIATGAARSAEI